MFYAPKNLHNYFVEYSGFFLVVVNDAYEVVSLPSVAVRSAMTSFWTMFKIIRSQFSRRWRKRRREVENFSYEKIFDFNVSNEGLKRK